MGFLRKLFGLKPKQEDTPKNSLDIQIEITGPQPSPYYFDEGPLTTEFRETIAQLKRDGEHDQALQLLQDVIAQLKKSKASDSAWPYEQAAIIYRKQKNYDEEINIIQQYFHKANIYPSARARKLAQRLPAAAKYATTPLDTSKFIRHGIIVDTETTGITANAEIIELAAILFQYNLATGEFLNVVDQYTGLRQPSHPIPKAATRIHGITDRDVRGQSLDETHLRHMWDQTNIVIAHNVSFDKPRITKLYSWTNKPKYKWLCSMNGVSWRQKGCSSKALQNLVEHYQLPPATAHRALGDVQSVSALLQLPDVFAELLIE